MTLPCIAVCVTSQHSGSLRCNPHEGFVLNECNTYAHYEPSVIVLHVVLMTGFRHKLHRQRIMRDGVASVSCVSKTVNECHSCVPSVAISALGPLSFRQLCGPRGKTVLTRSACFPVWFYCCLWFRNFVRVKQDLPPDLHIGSGTAIRAVPRFDLTYSLQPFAQPWLLEISEFTFRFSTTRSQGTTSSGNERDFSKLV